MEITFDLRHWFEPATSTADNAYALRALLDCMIALNSSYLRNHTVRPLYQSGVVYARTTVWDPIPALYKRGFGDCKSLACALIAEYRHRGIACEPEFRWIPRRNADGALIRDFHILVNLGNGRHEDPSKVLGMGANEVAPVTDLSQFHVAGEQSSVKSWMQKLGLGK
jgi:hypothetical protein